MPGKWHKEAYVKRIYAELDDYTVTPFISDAEADAIKAQLVTPLDGFVGQAYNYDDHGLTEEWMVTFADGASTGHRVQRDGCAGEGASGAVQRKAQGGAGVGHGLLHAPHD